MKFFKKITAGLLCAGMVLAMLPGTIAYADTEGSIVDEEAGLMTLSLDVDSDAVAISTEGTQMAFRDLTADEIVAEMGTGWNLGNTMDGHTGFTPNETVWQNSETTYELIKAVHDYGFNTVRIPVTWGTMIDDENDYAINETWISRVQDIVDYCISLDMYVIINIHHDGAEQTGWLCISSDDMDAVKEKYAGVWNTIATRFKDYDEHLIFEAMNEVSSGGAYTYAEDTAIIMELNQIFVDTVRATGSNNAVRWLSVTGRYTNIDATTSSANGFELPNDTVENRIFVAVHYYDWLFGLAENTVNTEFSDASVSALVEDFAKLTERFTSQGIPVILGEYGAINKNNTTERAFHYEVVNRLCQINGVVPVYWDQGWYDDTVAVDYSFTLIDRDTMEDIYPTLIAAIMRGYYFEGSEDCKDIARETVVTAITSFDVSDESALSVSVNVGDKTEISLADFLNKSDYNDVILWSSSDETIATVCGNSTDRSAWNATVTGKSCGVATITATSYEGGATLSFTVTVTTEAAAAMPTISGLADSYSLTVGGYTYMQLETDASYLSFRSTNTDVVTVSGIGKILAVGAGTAEVVIEADGWAVSVPVYVEEGEVAADITLALNVYFNDDSLGYYGNEVGPAITVSEAGQYTLTFDCASDLSAAAIAAGVSGISNIVSVYIKDDDVTNGLAKKSPLVSCDIIYDELLIDGVSYNINMTEAKSALKSSGIFDTNDPINSYDGSVIDEVSVKSYVLNFTSVENPTTISVTFTLSNMVFEEADEEAVTEISLDSYSCEAAGSEVVLGEEGTVISVTYSGNADSVHFVSENPSVLQVADYSGTPDANGTVSTTVYGVSEGAGTIYAYVADGNDSMAVMSCELTVVAAATVQETSEEAAEESSEAVEAAEAEEVTEEAAEETVSAQSSTGLSTGAIIAGGVVTFIVVFAGSLGITNLVSNKGKKKE